MHPEGMQEGGEGGPQPSCWAKEGALQPPLASLASLREARDVRGGEMGWGQGPPQPPLASLASRREARDARRGEIEFVKKNAYLWEEKTPCPFVQQTYTLFLAMAGVFRA